MDFFGKLGLAFQAGNILKELRKSRFVKKDVARDWNILANISNDVIKGNLSDLELEWKISDFVGPIFRSIDFNDYWVLEIETFINRAFNNKKFRVMAKGCNLSRKDMIDIFILMVIATMPNPVIKSGGTVLVPLVMFQETDRIFSVFVKSIIEVSHNDDIEERFAEIMVRSVLFAQEIKRQHDVARGNATL